MHLGLMLSAIRKGGKPVFNLFTKTEAFDNAAWTKASSTISADATAAPNGTTTADKLQEDNTTNFHTVVQSVTKTAASFTYTLSIYVKQAERTWIGVQLASGGNGYRQWFNVGTGAKGSSAAVGAGWSNPSASISSAPNGFYRCVFTITTDSTTTIALTLFTATGDTSTSILGTTGSGVYLWGAQLEPSDTAGVYVPA